MAKRKWSLREIELWREEHGGLGYTNREDKNLFVPKAIGFGWTLNWRNPWSWAIVAVILGLVFYSVLTGNKLNLHPWRDMIGP